MRALDLFCGGGGAARGILAAGLSIEIVGIDIKDHRKSYPGHFIQGDALNPPVRDWETSTGGTHLGQPAVSGVLTGTRLPAMERRALHPDLIPQTRQMLSRDGARDRECATSSTPGGYRFDRGSDVRDLPLVRRRHFEAVRVPSAVRATAASTTGARSRNAATRASLRGRERLHSTHGISAGRGAGKASSGGTCHPNSRPV